MNTEKRLNKGYKVKDAYYKKAMRRARKEKGTLANLIECVVVAYSYGLDIVAEKNDAQYDVSEPDFIKALISKQI